MPSPHALVALACIGLCAAASPAPAQLPSPLSSALYGFPGSLPAPPSAAAAGVALADRWLADEPAGNPAVIPSRLLVLSPALVRISRQDLAADNRHFDQQAAFFDGAGGWLAYGFGPLALAAYLSQPVLRRESNAFENGELDGITPPAVMRTEVTSRELRGGVLLSWGTRRARVGAAGEWTRRDDAYHTLEISGAPDAGERQVDFSGDGFGGQAGARLDLPGPRGGAITLGAAGRYVPSLSLTGRQAFRLGTGDSLATIRVDRGSGWEGGVSVRVAVGPSFRVIGGFGERSALDWDEFAVTSGRGTSWSVGMDYHDPVEPWTFRFGLGRERQSDVPESRAAAVGIGIGWRFSDTVLDLGIVRRSLDRADAPTSFDDRIVASLTLGL